MAFIYWCCKIWRFYTKWSVRFCIWYGSVILWCGCHITWRVKTTWTFGGKNEVKILGLTLIISYLSVFFNLSYLFIFWLYSVNLARYFKYPPLCIYVMAYFVFVSFIWMYVLVYTVLECIFLYLLYKLFVVIAIKNITQSWLLLPIVWNLYLSCPFAEFIHRVNMESYVTVIQHRG